MPLERGQPYWRNARSRMEALTRSGAVCECYKADRYGRQVCNVRLSDGSNVATHMATKVLATSQAERVKKNQD